MYVFEREGVNQIGGQMSPEIIFNLQLILGYVAWVLCFRAYILPKLKSMEQVDAHRAIATLHSFRFFGLVFILPGIVGPNLPAAGFGAFAAYWDLATGVLAMLALLMTRIRPLFWLFVVAFNLVGVVDLILDYYHAVRVGLPAMAGQLAVTYAIPILYVPVLMITHIVAFYWLLRPQPKAVRAFAGVEVASRIPA
jgi:nicotinamide riboside transporter PnuC